MNAHCARAEIFAAVAAMRNSAPRCRRCCGSGVTGGRITYLNFGVAYIVAAGRRMAGMGSEMNGGGGITGEHNMLTAVSWCIFSPACPPAHHLPAGETLARTARTL